MAENSPVILVMTIASSLFLVLAIILVLLRSRTLEMTLVLIGVFMALTAAVQGNFSGVAVDRGQVALTVGTGAGPLMKIAMVLVLSGVALSFVSRTNPPLASRDRQEGPHVG